MRASRVSELPFVVAVSAAETHKFTKENRESIILLPGLGVAGDAHCGAHVRHLYDRARNPMRPNLRQVHLLEHEILYELQSLGFHVKPGALGENITTQNLALLELKAGSLLRVGENVHSACDRVARTVHQNTAFGKWSAGSGHDAEREFRLYERCRYGGCHCRREGVSGDCYSCAAGGRDCKNSSAGINRRGRSLCMGAE